MSAPRLRLLHNIEVDELHRRQQTGEWRVAVVSGGMFHYNNLSGEAVCVLTEVVVEERDGTQIAPTDDDLLLTAHEGEVADYTLWHRLKLFDALDAIADGIDGAEERAENIRRELCAREATPGLWGELAAKFERRVRATKIRRRVRSAALAENAPREVGVEDDG